MRDRLKKAGSAIAGIAMCVLVAWRQGVLQTADRMAAVRAVADGATVSAAVLFAAALVRRLSQNGGLDGISYGLRCAKSFLLPMRGELSAMSYEKYVRERRQQQTKNGRDLFVTAMMFFVAGVMLSVLFCMGA